MGEVRRAQVGGLAASAAERPAYYLRRSVHRWHGGSPLLPARRAAHLQPRQLFLARAEFTVDVELSSTAAIFST